MELHFVFFTNKVYYIVIYSVYTPNLKHTTKSTSTLQMGSGGNASALCVAWFESRLVHRLSSLRLFMVPTVKDKSNVSH